MNFWQNTFLRRILINVGALAGSSLWRILISFGIQLFVARNLGLEALGQYTVALAYLNVSQVISELGLPTLLTRDLAQFPEKQRSTYQLALRIQLLASILVWVGLVLFAMLLPFSDTMQMALIVVGASLPFYAVTSASQTIFRASERMELVMIVEVVINTLILGASASVLWWGGGIVAVLGVLVGTQLISAMMCVVLMSQLPNMHEIRAERPTLRQGCLSNYADAKSLLQRSMSFYGLALSDVLLNRMDILLLGIVASEQVTGLYSAAYNLVRIILKLIQSYWQALYPTLSRVYQTQQVTILTLTTGLHQSTEQTTQNGYGQLVYKTVSYSLIALSPVVIVSLLFAEPILAIVYRGQYPDAVAAFRVLSLSSPLFLIETYLITRFMIESRVRQGLSVIGVHIGCVVVLLPLLSAFIGTLGAAWAVVIATLVGMVMGLWIQSVNRR
ncbi:MAG: oligosaccharide flippase family protein [Chloroflexota bacterium]